MTIAIKYFIVDPNGNFIDWAQRIAEFSILGKEAQIVGGGGVDTVFVQAGASADLTDLSTGNDVVYLTGNLAHYSQSIDQDTGVYTLTRTVGLSVGQSEVVKVTISNESDVLYFADGHITLNAESDARLFDGNSDTPFQTIDSAWLAQGGTPEVLSELGVSTTSTTPVKVFVFDSNGVAIPQASQVGQVMKVFGAGGADSVYVRAGTSVDATDLGPGDDKIYLTGKFADYTQSINQETGVYTLTRTTGLPVGAAEVVTITVGNENDVLYFADGRITLNAETDARLYDGNLPEPFQLIQSAWLDTAATTPGLSDIQSVTIDSTTGHTTVSNVNHLNAGDTVVFSVAMKKDVTVSGNPLLHIKIGALPFTATYDSVNSTASTLKFTYQVPASSSQALDNVGISINANAIDINGGTINLTTGGNAAKLINPQVANNGSYLVDNIAPTVAIAQVADADSADFASGFTVTTGATPVVKDGNNVDITSNFTQTATDVSGLDTYTAKLGAFSGSESVTVKASLTDSAGNTGNANQVVLIKPIDTTAPTGGTGMSFTSVTSSAQDTVADATTNQSTGSVVFTYTDANLGDGERFQYSTNGTDWTNVSATDTSAKTVTINGLDLTGNPNVRVRAIDAAGNATNALASQAITFDNAAPAVTGATGSSTLATQVKANSTFSVELTFNQAAILANGKQATIQLLIDKADGTGVQAITATATGTGNASDKLTFTTGVLPSTLRDTDGIRVDTNSLSFTPTEFKDAAGNDVSKTLTAIDFGQVRVDTVAPVFSVSSNTVNLNASSIIEGSTGTVLFKAAATDATDSSLTYSIKSGNTAGNFIIDASGNVRFDTGKKANGTFNNIVLEAKDTAGNTTTQVLNLNVSDSPTVTITHAPTGLAGTAGGAGDVIFYFQWSATVTDFTVDDITVSGGTIKTDLFGDEDAYSLVVTPNANTASGTLLVTVAQNAVSVGGETNALTPYSLPYDSLASMTMGSVTADGAVNAQERTDGFAITGTAEAGSTASYSLTKVGDSNFAPRMGNITVTSGSWSLPFSALDAGTTLVDSTAYRLVVTVTDPKGNTTSSTRDFSVDTNAGTLSNLVLSNDTAPAATFGGTLTKNTDTITRDASLALPSGVESGGVVQYRWVSGASVVPTDAAWTNVAWSNSYTAPTTDGTYTVQARQLDKAGNASSITSTSFTLDTQAAITIDLLQTTGLDNFINATEADSDLVITGTVKDIAGATRVGTSGTLTLSLNSKNYAGTITSEGTWTATVPKLDVKALVAKVPYALTARVTDAAGNTASSNSVNITYDNTTTQVASVVTTSTQMAKVGDTLDLMLGFDGQVTLGNGKTATVVATVDTAGGGTQDITLTATGTGTAANTLRFVSSTLPTGLSDYNGITVKTDSLTFVAGDFKGQTGADVSSTFSAITNIINEKVDTTAPTVTASGPSSPVAAGQGDKLTVDLTFSENIILSSGQVARVVLVVNKSGGGTQEVTASVTGTGALTNKLSFSSSNLPLGTLADTDGITVKAGSLSFEAGKLVDQAGNAPTVASLTDTLLSNYTVDTQVANVLGGVNPTNVDKVGSGQTIGVDLSFDKNVLLAAGQTATVTLLVDNTSGGKTEITAIATGTGASSKTLTFTSAAITATDLLDTNGVEIKAGSLSYGKLPGTTTDVLLDATGATINNSIASNITLANEQVDLAVRSITINPLSMNSGMNAVQATGTAIGLDGQTINLTVGGLNTTAVVQSDGGWTADAVDLSSLVTDPDPDLVETTFQITASVTYNSQPITATPVTAQFDSIAPTAAFDAVQASDGILGSTQERDAALTLTGSSTGLNVGATFVITATGTGVDSNKDKATATVIKSDGSWKAIFGAGAFTNVSDGSNAVTFTATPTDRAGNPTASPITSSLAVKASSAFVTIDPLTLYANSDFDSLKLTGILSNASGGWVEGSTFDVTLQNKTFTATLGAVVNGVAKWATPVLSTQLARSDFKDTTALIDYATASTMVLSSGFNWDGGNTSKITDGLSGTAFELHPYSTNGQSIQFTAPNLVTGGEFIYYNRTDGVRTRINGSKVQFILVDASGTETVVEETTISVPSDSATYNVVTITPSSSTAVYNRVKLVFVSSEGGSPQNFREIDWKAYPLLDGTTTAIGVIGNDIATSAIATVSLRTTGPVVTFDALQAGDNKLDAVEKTQALTLTGSSTGLSVGDTFVVTATGNGVDSDKNSATATVGQLGSWTATFEVGAFADMNAGSSLSFSVNKATTGSGTKDLLTPVSQTITLAQPNDPYLTVDPLAMYANSDFAQLHLTGTVGNGTWTVGDTFNVTFQNKTFTATVGAVDNGVAKWSTPALSSQLGKGDFKTNTLTDYATANTLYVSSGALNWQGTPRDINWQGVSTNKIVDGLSGNSFEMEAYYANGQYIQFTAPNLVAGGQFVYYNRTDGARTRINGSKVQFILVDASGTETLVEEKTISVPTDSATYNVLTITPTSSTAPYNRVKLLFQADPVTNPQAQQNFREIDWQAYALLDGSSTAITASSNGFNAAAVAAVNLMTNAPVVTFATTQAGDNKLDAVEKTQTLVLTGSSTGLNEGDTFEVTATGTGVDTTKSTATATVGQSGAWTATFEAGAFSNTSAGNNLNFSVAGAKRGSSSLSLANPVSTTLALAAPNDPYISIDPLSLNAQTDWANLQITGQVGGGFVEGDTFTVSFKGQNYTATVGAVTNGTATWSAPIAGLSKGSFPGTPLTDYATASTMVLSSGISWNGDNTSKITDGLSGSSFELHPYNTNGQSIQFTAPNLVTGGEFIYYNRTDGVRTRINGSKVQFILVDASGTETLVEEKTITVPSDSATYNVLTITPTNNNAVYNRVKLVFVSSEGGSPQNFREIDWKAYPLLDGGSFDVTATATKNNGQVQAAGKIWADMVTPALTMSALAGDNAVASAEASAATLSGNASVEDGQTVQLLISKGSANPVTKNVTVTNGAWATSLDFVNDSALTALGLVRGSQVKVVASVSDKAGNTVTLAPVLALFGDNVPVVNVNALSAGALVTSNEVSAVAVSGSVTHFNSGSQTIEVVFTTETGQTQAFNAQVTASNNGSATWSLNLTADQVKALPQLQALTVSAQIKEGGDTFASTNTQLVTLAVVEPVPALAPVNNGTVYGANATEQALESVAVSGTVSGLPTLPNGAAAKVSLQLVSGANGAAIGTAKLATLSSSAFNDTIDVKALMATPGNVASWASVTGASSTVSLGLADGNTSSVTALGNSVGGALRYTFGNTVLNGGTVSYVTDADGKTALIGSTVNFSYGGKVVKTITVADSDFSSTTATFNADSGQLYDEVYFVLASKGQQAAEVQINPTALAALDAKVQAKTVFTLTGANNTITTVTGANVASTSVAVDKAAPLVSLDAVQAGNNIIDGTEKAQAVAITGSANGGDGGTVTVTLKDSGDQTIGSYQAQVVSGRWTANIPQNVATALVDGSYSLSASLTDANSNTSVTPATGNVTVKALAPAITITSMDGSVQADGVVNAAEKTAVVFKGALQNVGDTPALTIQVAGQTLNANTVSFNTAAGTWQTTQNLNTLAPVGTDVAGRWTATGSSTLGSGLTLTHLTDNDDNTTQVFGSSTFKFINLSSGGLVSYSGGTVTVKATAGTTSGAMVEFYDQGNLVKSVALTLTDGNTTAGTWTANVGTDVRYDQVRLRLPDATQTLSGVSLTPTALAAVSVVAQVSDGGLLSQAASAKVTVDELAPVVTLNNLTADNYVSATEAGQTQQLSGTATGASDGAVVSVYKYVQGANANTGVLLGTAQVSNGSWQLPVSSNDLTAWGNGSYTLQANVSDAAGNQGLGTLNILRGDDKAVSVDAIGNNSTVVGSIAGLTSYTITGKLTDNVTTDEVWVNIGSLDAQKASVDHANGTWTLNANLSGLALSPNQLQNTALASKGLMTLGQTGVTQVAFENAWSTTSALLSGLVDGITGDYSKLYRFYGLGASLSAHATEGRVFIGGGVKLQPRAGTSADDKGDAQAFAGTKVQFLLSGQVMEEQTITYNTTGYVLDGSGKPYIEAGGFLTVLANASTQYDEVKLVFASAYKNEFNGGVNPESRWTLTEFQVLPSEQIAISNLAITAQLRDSNGTPLLNSTPATVNFYEKSVIGITNELAGNAYLIQSEVSAAYTLRGYALGIADGTTVTVTEPTLTNKTYTGTVQSGQWTALVPKADLPTTGSLTFTATATGLDNLQTSGTLTANVLASRPAVSLNTISADGVVGSTESSTLTLRGSSSGLNTGSTVTLKLGTVTLGTTTTENDGSWSKAIDVSAYTQLGKNLLTASAINGKALYSVTADLGLAGTEGLYDGAVASTASASVGQSVISGAQGKTVTFALAHDYAGGMVKLFNGLTEATALQAGAVIKLLYNGTVVGSYTTVDGDKSLAEITTSVASSVVFNTVSITFNQSDAVLRELQIVPTHLAIRADAALGNLSATPGIASYTLDTAAPTLTVAPVTGDNVVSDSEAGGTVGISGTTTGAETGQKVTVTDSFGNVVATGTVGNVNASTGVGSWSAELSSGYVSGLSTGMSSTLKLNVMDVAGNAAQEQSLTLWRVASAPTFSMSTGDSTLNATEWVSGTALASGTSGVTSRVNAVSLTLTNSSGYSTTRSASTDGSGAWDYKLSATDLNQLRNLPANTNVLVKAVVSSSLDSATAVWGTATAMVDGNTSSSIGSGGNNQWFMFTLDKAYQGGALVLNLTSASDSRLIGAKVEFLRSGQVIETDLVTSGGASNLLTVNAASTTTYDQVRFTFPGTSAEGQYGVSEMKLLPNSVVETALTVKAVLTDANGVTVSLPDATVTVDADTPVLSFGSTPVAGDGVINNTEAAAGFAISGSAIGAQAGEVVTVKLGSTTLGTATIAADGRSWTLAASQTNGTGDGMTAAGKTALGNASGAVTLTAAVLDHNGATSATASVTALRAADAAAPAVRITSLSDGVLSANDLDSNGNYVISGQADNLNGQTVSVNYAGKTYTSSAVSGSSGATWTVTIPKADVNPVIGNLMLNMGYFNVQPKAVDVGWANGSWDMFQSMKGYFGPNPVTDGVIGFDPNATAGWTTATGGAATWYLFLNLDGAREYQGGTMRIYNALGASGSYINGSIVTFVRDGQVVKQQTISNAGDVIDISAAGLVYDSAFIYFSNATQSLREVQLLDAQLGEVHAVTNAQGVVSNTALSTITATAISNGVPVVASVSHVGLDQSAANLSSGSVSTGKVNLSFDEVLNTGTFSDTSGWNVLVNGQAKTVSDITAASGDSKGLTLALASTTLGSTDVVQLSYTGSTIKDAEGNKLAAFGSAFIGSDGADTLTALATGSTLIGGGGNDTLIGGAGVDRFVIASINDDNDTIRNFTVNNSAHTYATMAPDVLDLRGLFKSIGLTRSQDLGMYMQYTQSTTDPTLVQIKIDQHGIADFGTPDMVINVYNTSATTTQTQFFNGVWGSMVVL